MITNASEHGLLQEEIGGNWGGEEEQEQEPIQHDFEGQHFLSEMFVLR